MNINIVAYTCAYVTIMHDCTHCNHYFAFTNNTVINTTILICIPHSEPWLWWNRYLIFVNQYLTDVLSAYKYRPWSSHQNHYCCQSLNHSSIAGFPCDLPTIAFHDSQPPVSQIELVPLFVHWLVEVKVGSSWLGLFACSVQELYIHVYNPLQESTN